MCWLLQLPPYSAVGGIAEVSIVAVAGVPAIRTVQAAAEEAIVAAAVVLAVHAKAAIAFAIPPGAGIGVGTFDNRIRKSN